MEVLGMDAIVGAIAALVVVVLSQMFERSRRTAEAHRDRKVEVYAKFGHYIVSMILRTTHEEGDKSRDDTKQQVVNFKRDVLMFGSPSVVRALLDVQAPEGAGEPVMMDKLLRAIRKDMGLSNTGLLKGDLVKVFITDPAEFDKMMGR